MKTRSQILVAVILLVLWLPTLDTLLKLDPAKGFDENRRLAGFPSLSEGFNQRYLNRLEACFNDHFGFRRSLIRTRLELETYLNLGNVFLLVRRGRDNWLYTTDAGAMENYSGRTRLTEPQLRQWQALLEQRRDSLASRGIKYLLVIAPDKQDIYPEYLPPRLTRVRNNTALDELLAYLRHNCTVNILDLRPPLLAAKARSGLIYYKSDTHWNLLGACFASQAILTALTNDFPRLYIPSPSDFQWKWERTAGGDMARLMGLHDFQDQGAFSQPSPSLPPLAITPPITYSSTNILVSEATPIVTATQTGLGRALVFRDSFGSGLVPFLGYSFSNTVYLKSDEFDERAIDAERPDVVISERCERLLLQEIQRRSSTALRANAPHLATARP